MILGVLSKIINFSYVYIFKVLSFIFYRECHKVLKHKPYYSLHVFPV